jgi:hypothetical protein
MTRLLAWSHTVTQSRLVTACQFGKYLLMGRGLQESFSRGVEIGRTVEEWLLAKPPPLGGCDAFYVRKRQKTEEQKAPRRITGGHMSCLKVQLSLPSDLYANDCKG